MNDDDDNFFTNLDRGDNALRNRLRNAARNDDDILMPAAPPSFEEDEGETPLQQLIRHWMNERHAPDILPVAENVLAGLLDHIRRQVGKIHSSIRPSRNGFMTWYLSRSPRPFSCCGPIPRPLRKNTLGLCSLRQRSSV